MSEQKVKRRRTSTKHSQTGCKTCKMRHIKCDETRPRCQNCEKGDRECIYASKSPPQISTSLPPETPVTSVAYFDQPFSFRQTSAQTPTLPVPPIPNQRYAFEDVYSTPHSFEAADSFGTQRSSTPSVASITPSPQIRHPSIGNNAIVRNAVLVNTVQTQSTLQKAIHSISNGFRLRGHSFTIEGVLSPLIHRSNAIKHAIIAWFILQADEVKSSPSSPLPQQDLAGLQLRHYSTAVNHLQTTLHNPAYTDANVCAFIVLAFYDVCAGNIPQWFARIRGAADHIRLRGTTLDAHPLSLREKFVFTLYMRMDTVGCNATGQPSNVDSDIVRIVYSGVPIFGKHVLLYRIELDLLLAEISVFQSECVTLAEGWQGPTHQEVLQGKYDDLVDRLGRWHGANAELAAFEDAEVGEYPYGTLLPPEMGLPVLCDDQEFAHMWLVHCTAIVHVHCTAIRHRIIPQVPESARDAAILACRIISGMTIIDPAEPSASALWPLINASYVLDITPGKLWIVDQLDSIANRYLNRTARTVAQQVRQTIVRGDTSLQPTKFEPQFVASEQPKLVVPNAHAWAPGASSSEEVYPAYIPEERNIPTSSSGAQSDVGIRDELFPHDPRKWNPQIQTAYDNAV